MANADEPDAVLSAGDTEIEDAAKLALEQEEILSAVAASRLDTIEQRVAWLLNRRVDTRDSDISLAIAYWEAFEDGFDRGAFTPESLYHLQRIGSLTRARARIQNTLKLFQASDDVRASRGTLAEDERQRARRPPPPAHPPIAVFLDETGKNETTLIVGGLWALSFPEERALAHETRKWLEAQQWKELHFVKITAGNLHQYLDYLTILEKRFATFGFKYMAIQRPSSGVAAALGKLFYHLVCEGIAHDAESGRAALPRFLNVWKDREDDGNDALLLADIRDRMSNAAASRFSGQLEIGELKSVASDGNQMIQICDLFIGSINRCMNGQGLSGEHPKDRFARTVLDRFNVTLDTTTTIDDMACRLQI
jgi:hypothetical protein